MRKLKFNARTIDDALAVDGLCAVSRLDDKSSSKGMYYLVGGFATQSYLPGEYRRPTADIDLAIMKPLTNEEFEQFSSPVQEFLRDKGYAVDTNKGQNAFELFYSKGGEGAVIEFNRRTLNNFQRMEKRLCRELENSRSKIIPGTNSFYRVCSSEDIALPKIVRGVGSLERSWDQLYRHTAAEVQPLTEEGVKSALKEIKELREAAIIHAGDLSRSEELRFAADLFDVRALTCTVGFVDNYLLSAAADWDALRIRTRERDVLFNYLLPQLFKVGEQH